MQVKSALKLQDLSGTSPITEGKNAKSSSMVNQTIDQRGEIDTTLP